MLKSSCETHFKKIIITSSFVFQSDSKLQVFDYQWTRLQILFPSTAQGALPKIQTVLTRSLGPPALIPRGRGLGTLQATKRWAHKVFIWGSFLGLPFKAACRWIVLVMQISRTLTGRLVWNFERLPKCGHGALPWGGAASGGLWTLIYYSFMILHWEIICHDHQWKLISS